MHHGVGGGSASTKPGTFLQRGRSANHRGQPANQTLSMCQPVSRQHSDRNGGETVVHVQLSRGTQLLSLWLTNPTLNMTQHKMTHYNSAAPTCSDWHVKVSPVSSGRAEPVNYLFMTGNKTRNKLGNRKSNNVTWFTRHAGLTSFSPPRPHNK